MDEPLLCATANFLIPTRYVFQFNGVEICPTIEEFSAIMGRLDVSTLFLPTIGEDFAYLALDLLGISLVAAWRWCMLNKLNICIVFAYFSQLAIPMAGRAHSHYLKAFCLCLLARYFLVHETYQVDQRVCLVVNNLNKGSPVGMNLAETLTGLDTVYREEATFFVGSPFLL